jgi:hypothetical protein
MIETTHRILATIAALLLLVGARRAPVRLQPAVPQQAERTRRRARSRRSPAEAYAAGTAAARAHAAPRCPYREDSADRLCMLAWWDGFEKARRDGIR